jgi:glutamyl-tRNA synthetase
MSVKVRFPPSPTGYCHVGTARMAIINYLFAKRAGGTIVFRSEDTDKERSTREYEEDIKDQLAWLGISWDEFYRTSELLERHKAAMARLVAEDKAYVSKEESKRVPGVEVELVRLRNPGKALTFSDVVRGDITFDTTELGDFAIGRAIDDPLYHLAVVVDDAEMGITHVIRGEDHISNTPRQILIQEALGYERPVYAHYPLLLGSDRAKLSKRTGDVAVRQYREAGYLPEALLNYIAMLGWTPPSEREIMSLDEMVQEFALEDLHKSGAIFDIEKLRWYNKEYMRTESDEVFATEALRRLKAAIEARGGAWDERTATRMLPLLRERIEVWGDIATQAAEGEYDFFFVDPVPAKSEIPQKGSDAATAARHLAHVHEMLEAAGEEIFEDPERLKNIVWDYASSEGRGEVLWPLRFSLSGRAKSPDPFTIASAIGRERTLSRIATARTSLEV